MEFKTKPYQHQLDCWEQSKEIQNFAYLMEMGCGKSKPLVDTIAWLFLQGKIRGALIIAPKGAYRNWTVEDTGEIDLHMPAEVDYFTAYWSAYQTAEVKKSLNSVMKKSDLLHILVMNVEALSTNKGYDFAFDFMKSRPCLIAVDESTTIKNMTATRTKNILKLAKLANYRRILTGQPVTKSPLDLYAQLMFLDWRILGFSSYYAFRSRYAILKEMKFGNRSFLKVEGFQRLDELKDKLQSHSYRVTKADCLDLPPKVYMTREIELTDDQVKMYNAMAKEAITFIENNQVSVQNVMSRLQKQHQIVCGHLIMDNGQKLKLKHNRVNELLQLLEEIDGKVIVWAAYRADIWEVVEAIAHEYGPESVSHFYGDTTDEQRELNKKNFQNPSHPLRFLVGNPATGRFGTTLTEASTVIYYSYTWDLEHRNQSEDRAHRIGSEKHEKITYITFVSSNTIEEKIFKSLESKQKLSDALLGDVSKGTWKNWFNKV